MKKIILIGPKCSGKTCAGKAAAKQAALVNQACDFIDVDELIFQKTGKTPREIYNESQAMFQDAEAEAIFDIANNNKSIMRIIAAGGGLTDNIRALDALKNTETVFVYLEISADCAWNRIINLKDDLPPFLKTENPRETHRTLHERRAAACAETANFTIKNGEKTPEETAKEILKVFIE